MKVVFNPFTGKFDIIPSTAADVGAGTGNISGSGIIGRVAQFSGSGSNITSANIIGPNNVLTITTSASSTLALNINSGSTLTLVSDDNHSLIIGNNAYISGSNTGDVSLPTNSGLSLIGQSLSVGTPSTITNSSINSVTTNTHTHAITGSPTLLGNAPSQYKVIVSGSSPYPASWSNFSLDGMSGGKTVLSVTSGSTLTLVSPDNYTITFRGSGSPAYTQDNLSVFAATTSAQLAGVLSDETGSGAAMFNTRPTTINPAETVQTLTFATPIAWNMDTGAHGVVTLTGNTTIQAPTNFRAGGYYTLRILQDVTGNRKITQWSDTFQWSGNILPILSTVANGIDIFGFNCDGTYLYGIANPLSSQTIVFLDDGEVSFGDDIVYL